MTSPKPHSGQDTNPRTEGGAGRERMREVARRFQAEHFEFEVTELHIDATVGWNGDVRIVRRFEDCRPNSTGRPVWEIAFRERALGVSPGEQEPRLQVRKAPRDVEHESRSSSAGGWSTHRLFFPHGWTRGDESDSLSFMFQTDLRGALVIESDEFLSRESAAGHSYPLRRSLNFHLPYFVDRLFITLSFPDDYEPARWEAWSWWGMGMLKPMTRNLLENGVCRSASFHPKGCRSELEVNEPLAGYTFALIWIPSDRPQLQENSHPEVSR